MQRASLSDGTLVFQMQRPAELPKAAFVVECRHSDLFKLEHVNGGWVADVLARLQVRYPEIQVVFADSRKFGEEWTYRLLAAVLADATDSANQPRSLRLPGIELRAIRAVHATREGSKSPLPKPWMSISGRP